MKENQEFVAEIENYIHSLGLEYQGYDTIRKVSNGMQVAHMADDKEVFRKGIITGPSCQPCKLDIQYIAVS
jgi:hypothetical protein